ncbi:MAG: methyltransferase domain-containing protein [Gemmatimonadota bacterium]
MTTLVEDGIDAIRDYYGRVLQSSSDLKSGACCAAETLPDHLKEVAATVHPEVQARFYGCGAPIPPALDGVTVLDIGCGAGRDAYVLSALVGEQGRVFGLDMTKGQLEVARAYRDWHADRFGMSQSNVHFLDGLMEDLASAGLEDESIDVVVSNCVFNLSPDKPRLFAEVFRTLKPGGELYFSDVFADRRVPAHLREDPVLLGECLAGAMYVEDFRRIVTGLGCADVRLVHSRPVDLGNPDFERRVGMVGFTSRTYRAFKLPLEDRCEDYGEVATYLGSIPTHPHAFELDDHHRFESGRPLRVCGNTADMLSRSRYAPHFRVDGSRTTHFGLFDCGPAAAVSGAGGGGTPCC